MSSRSWCGVRFRRIFLLRRCARARAGAVDCEQFKLEGLLAVEMFITKIGELLVNELAPRPHNSYHSSERACVTSQFEQAIRAVCNLPLGDVEVVQPAAIVNLLGDVWLNANAETGPRFDLALAVPGVRLHLYEKHVPRAGRKMGHLSAVGKTAEEAVRHVWIIASGGDSGLALRAYSQAQGNRGLGMWQNEPDRAWVEGFPEGRSYVRRLATRYRFVCPLLGSDLNIILRPGQLPWQAFYVRNAFRRPSTSTPSCWRTRPDGHAASRLRVASLGSGSTTRLTSTFASHWSKRSPRTRSPRPTWLVRRAGQAHECGRQAAEHHLVASPDRPLPGDGKR